MKTDIKVDAKIPLFNWLFHPALPLSRFLFITHPSLKGSKTKRLRTCPSPHTLLLNSEKQIELPFNFEIKNVKGKFQLIIHNAQERIVVEEISFKKDSFNFKMPVFDTEFKTQLIGDSLLTGVWVNHTKKENKTIHFTAKHGNKNRFDFAPEKPQLFYEGKWETTFSPNTIDSSKAIGIFKHVINSSTIEGTFLTETGDYRYLEGTVQKNKVYLSCFDEVLLEII